MAQAGYTPISLYYSTTAAAVPVNTNLTNGELAINITDGKLYYKDNSGTVKLLAGTGGAGIAAGSNTQIQFNSSGSFGASSSLTFDGTTFSAPNSVITSSSSSAALRITQTGSGDSLLVEDSANPDSTPFVVTTDGRVVIGGTSAVSPTTGITPWLQLQGTTAATSSIGAMRFSADVNQPYYVFAKSRSTTKGTFGTIVQSSDALGTVLFTGDDGSSTPISAASIEAAVDGTPGTNDMPGRLVFSTTADGASTPTERVRIASTGAIGLSGANYGTSGQVLTSGGSGAAPTWTTPASGGSAATPTALGTVYASTTSTSTDIVAFGYQAGNSSTGSYSTAIGYQTMLTNSGAFNTAIGYQSLQNPTGGRNVAIGRTVLQANTSGNFNVGIGGANTLGANTTGANNIGVGDSALAGNTTGGQNVALGVSALASNITNNYNTAVGHLALNTATADQNVAVGWYALQKNTTASGNTAMGAYVMNSNTTGASNTAVGFSALGANTTASNNTAVGYNALAANTTGDISVAVGMNALKAQTTATQNTAVGYGAGAKLTTAGYNVAVGVSALANMVNGAQGNVAVGQNALLNFVNTSVYEGGAVAVGQAALQNCTTGGSNIAMGRNAGLSITTGSSNIVIGDRAGESANSTQGVYLGTFCGIYTTGNDNTFLGWQAGHYVTSTTTGSQNTYVGSGSRGSAVSNTYEIVLGAYATGKGSTTGFISPNGGGVYQGNNSSTWSTTSDRRLKKNIVDNNDGLDKITSIRVRNFEYRLPEEVDAELQPADAVIRSGVQLGVIAQELQAVLPECVKQESTGVLSVDTDNLTWYLINAVKQLKAEIDQLKGN